ncbi:MAG: hypothetical protein HRU20_00790 [Pseudomonadales bacterium]|nr:hypothetical protein [Pseudomonadales bacterium]
MFKHKLLINEVANIFHCCDVGGFTLFAAGNRKRKLTVMDENHCHYRVE